MAENASNNAIHLQALAHIERFETDPIHVG